VRLNVGLEINEPEPFPIEAILGDRQRYARAARTPSDIRHHVKPKRLDERDARVLASSGPVSRT
jgi:hypothetical protein